MQAAEAKFQKVLDGNKQFLVPHYQRPYSWADEQWKVLWRDILQLMEEENPQPHFLGSIVTSPARSIPEGIEKRLLIDGQQRLTTLLILLILIRDMAREAGATKLAQQTEGLYLTNQYESGSEFYKLLPTQGEDPRTSDRHNFVRLVRGEEVDRKTSIGAAHTWFRDRLRRAGAPSIEDLQRTIVGKLTLVSIILDEHDNPHRIFESLNGKGRPLSQADLIRNYFFMRIHEAEHEHTYVHLWRPMQRRLGDETLTPFVRHLLSKEGAVVRESDVYSTLKLKVDEDRSRSPIDHLKELDRASNFYKILLAPPLVECEPISTRLQRLNRLEVTVAYPFLLGVLDDRALGRLTDADVCIVLDVMESYLVRRFVCGVPTHGLNKVFAALYGQARSQADFVEAVKSLLAARGCPRDEEFRERLESARLYGGGERRDKTKLILERLEESHGHKEQVVGDKLSIEHVMPRSLTDEWRAELGPTWEDDHEQLLHTLGNLTLTSYNPELTNDGFAKKRQLYASSHLELNRYFAGVEKWTNIEIEGRAASLADRAIRVWPWFGPEQSAIRGLDRTSVTGTIPKIVTIRGREVAVKSWVDVAYVTLRAIIESGEDEFERVAAELPKFVNRDATALRRSSRPRLLPNGAYLETNFSAKNLYVHTLQAAQLAGLVGEEWSVAYGPAGSVDESEDEVGPDDLEGELSRKSEGRLEFWSDVRAALMRTGKFPNLQAPREQYWFDVKIGWSDIWILLFASVQKETIGVRLVFSTPTSERLLEALMPQRAAIEAELGGSLDWNPHPFKKFKTIRLVRPSSFLEPGHRDEAIEWLVGTAVGFRSAFEPRLEAARVRM